MLMAARDDELGQLRQPANVETEAALLGALMIDNRLVDTLGDLLRPEDFFETVHGRIYATITQIVASGALATPVLLKPMLEDDPGLVKLGGPGYLAQLTGSGAALIGARDFAVQVADLAKRRRLLEALESARTELCYSPMDLRQRIENPDGKSIAEVLDGLDTAMSAALERSSTTSSMSLVRALDSELVTLDEESEGKSTPGLRLEGFKDWNILTGLMRRGEAIVLGGRPGMGKTTVALRAALCSGAAGNGTLFISLEMTIKELARKAIADLVFEYGQGPTFDQIRGSQLQPHERRRVQEARERIASWPFEITDPSSLRIGRLAMLIRRHKRRFAARGQSLDVVFIDYLGLILPDRESGSRTNDIGVISRTIKELAKACGVCIVLLAQLNRAVEGRDDKRPQLSDLRDSGDIEQDADTVLFVYREEYYLTQNEPKEGDKRRIEWQLALDASRDKVELIAAKRRGGRAGVRRVCNFFAAHQAVRDSDFLSSRGGYEG